MKKHIATILFLFSCLSNAFTQVNEVGFLLGGANLIGDVGSDFYLIPKKISGGVVLKHNLNPRVAIRGNYNFIKLANDDEKATNLYRKAMGRKFENTLHEFGVGIEFNFLEFNVAEVQNYYSPYILLQLAGISYKTANAVSSEGKVTNFKTNFSATIPVGLGFKGRLYERINFAVESAIRFTFTDELDYSTNKFTVLNFGGNGNDHYVFTGVSLTYTFGRPACYTPRE